MIGNTSNECLMYLNMMVTKELLDTVSSFQRYVPRDLELKVDSEKRLEYGEILRKHYYGDSQPATDNLTGIINILNDWTLWHPMYRLIMSRLTHGSGKTFAYRFDYVSKNNLFRKFFKFDPELPEAIHGDDVGYVFRVPSMEGDDFNLSVNSIEFEGIKLMLDIFTNFAANGNPNSKMLDEVIWLPATKEAPFKGLNISEKGSKIINFPELDRVKVFNDLYTEHVKILY
jgi:carboxylesterase type B